MAEHNTNNASEALLLKRISRQEEILNQLALRSQALEYENSRLRLLLYNSWLNKGNIPPEEVDKYELLPMYLEDVMAILQQPVELFNFNTRVLLTFRALDIGQSKTCCLRSKNIKCIISNATGALARNHSKTYSISCARTALSTNIIKAICSSLFEESSICTQPNSAPTE